jgi:GT2 family glycosyltransferase
VGAVGAKLSFGDGRLQHVGVVGVAGNIGHPFYEFPADHRGHHDNTIVAANFLAVTAACMMSRRDCFESVGGFSLDFPLNYNDIDYCLKLRQAGYRVVWTPEAHLSHFETSTRGVPTVADDERDRILERWGRFLERDPYYNPNFLRSSGDFATPIYLEDGRRFPSLTADINADRPDRLHGVR